MVNTVSNTGGNAPAPGLAKPERKSRLAVRAEELLADRIGQTPIWIRAPKHGSEFYSGFSRSKLYQLAAEGHIRSISVREPGAVKGTRLFHLASILEFIAKCEREGGAL